MPEKNLVAVGHEKGFSNGKAFLITLHQQVKVFKAPEASSYQSGATSTVSTWISLSLTGCSSAEPASVSANFFN